MNKKNPITLSLIILLAIFTLIKAQPLLIDTLFKYWYVPCLHRVKEIGIDCRQEITCSSNFYWIYVEDKDNSWKEYAKTLPNIQEEDYTLAEETVEPYVDSEIEEHPCETVDDCVDYPNYNYNACLPRRNLIRGYYCATLNIDI